MFCNISFLPVLGLNTQPVAVTASAGPEADAGEGGEGLQSTGDDGLLTGVWQDRTTQHLAFTITQHRKYSGPFWPFHVLVIHVMTPGVLTAAMSVL